MGQRQFSGLVGSHGDKMTLTKQPINETGISKMLGPGLPLLSQEYLGIVKGEGSIQVTDRSLWTHIPALPLKSWVDLG